MAETTLGGRWNLSDVPEDIEPIPAHRTGCSSKYRGVTLIESLTPGKPDLYKAGIYAFGTNRFLGVFATEEEAGRYYARAHHKVSVMMEDVKTAQLGAEADVTSTGPLELDLSDVPEDMDPILKNREGAPHASIYRGAVEYETDVGGLQWAANITHDGQVTHRCPSWVLGFSTGFQVVK
jgi:hypothetical protein